MIEINNLTSQKIDEKFLKNICQKVLEKEKRKECQLSIAIIGPARIRQLNKKYLGKNRATDVLSFPELKNFKVGESVKNLGEIVICPREVKKNAKRFDSPFEKELARVLIHGILHLLGYDHEKSPKIGVKKENYYLSRTFRNIYPEISKES